VVSRSRSTPKPVSTNRHRPATTPEGRENQLVSMAVDLVQQRMQQGTASAQEIVHFLKLGSTREQLEQDRLRRENELLTAKVENLASAKNIEKLYSDAISAMRSYQGQEVVEDDYDDSD